MVVFMLERQYMGRWQRDLLLLGVFFVASLIGTMTVITLLFWPMSASDWEHIAFPTSLQQAQDLGRVLSAFKQEYYLRTVLCHTCCYMFLQTFAIPGTGFANLLAGALFGLRLGLSLAIIYSTVGAAALYYVSQIFCSRIIRRFFDRRLQQFQTWARHHKANLFLRLISIRVFPFTPNWFVNIACGQLSVPMHIFLPSTFLGLMPYTFMGCQAGTVLAKLHSMQDVMQPQVVGGLVAAGAVGFLLPAIANKLRRSHRRPETQQ